MNKGSTKKARIQYTTRYVTCQGYSANCEGSFKAQVVVGESPSTDHGLCPTCSLKKWEDGGYRKQDGRPLIEVLTEDALS